MLLKGGQLRGKTRKQPVGSRHQKLRLQKRTRPLAGKGERMAAQEAIRKDPSRQKEQKEGGGARGPCVQNPEKKGAPKGAFLVEGKKKEKSALFSQAWGEEKKAAFLKEAGGAYRKNRAR